MLKLSNTTKNAAFAALLGMGLVGSAAVTLMPTPAQAQMRHDFGDRFRSDDRFRGDRDDRFRGDRDDRFRGDWDDRFRFGVGLGFYGYPGYYPYYSGYYDPYYYGPYCSSYDYYYGYCSY